MLLTSLVTTFDSDSSQAQHQLPWKVHTVHPGIFCVLISPMSRLLHCSVCGLEAYCVTTAGCSVTFKGEQRFSHPHCPIGFFQHCLPLFAGIGLLPCLTSGKKISFYKAKNEEFRIFPFKPLVFFSCRRISAISWVV